MAISAATVWRIRISGDNTNGGGYDATISGAGTDYTDQDAAQLSVGDVVTVGSTTVTSITGVFTTAMIGNCIQIGGDGYYFITACASANSITVDRNTGTATGQTGKVGGAFASQAPLSNGGSQSPTIASPLTAGNTIYVRGAGSSTPSSADYTVANSTYWNYPAGDTTSGPITWIGYNGVPYIQLNAGGLYGYQVIRHIYKNIKWGLATGDYSNFGVVSPTSSASGIVLINCQVDQNGSDSIGLVGQAIIGCWAMNTGSTSAGTAGRVAFTISGIPGVMQGCRVDNWRNNGVRVVGSDSATIINNIITGCTGIGISNEQTSLYECLITGNTIDSCDSDGIALTTNEAIECTIITNNIITANGGYGVNASTGSTTVNDKLKTFIDYNIFGTGGTANTSGAYNNLTAGPNDQNVDPSFVGGGDYTPTNAALEGTAFPVSIP